MALNRQALTTGQAAKLCGVSFRTVIRWIERGRLKAYKLPGRGDNRIPTDSLVAFLRENDMPIPDDLHDLTRRVLIVDDEPEMALAVQRVLIRRGYETAVALGGFQAGMLIQSFRPVLMTLDLQMPGMNGIGVIEFMRQQDDLKDIKILVVSGMSESKLADAIARGADGSLAKPFSNEQLLEKVEQLIGSGARIES